MNNHKNLLYSNLKNAFLKNFAMEGLTLYFNSSSELYIPYSLYEATKGSPNGIFEAINYFDLEFYMNMYNFNSIKKYCFFFFFYEFLKRKFKCFCFNQ